MTGFQSNVTIRAWDMLPPPMTEQLVNLASA